jgi:GH25 family lysozyme M1 (1,4-beta-N-acetylmuramidase)
VEGLPGPASAVVAGELHSCALLAAGRGLYCWGDGSEGQLGSAAHGPTPAPVEVAGLPPVRQLATGGEHTCALTEAGAVLCWGSNRFGELGDGAEDDRATPRPVSGLEAGAVELSSGDRFTCGRLATGEVRCWGVRQLGQLGAELPPSPPGERAALSSRTPVTVELASPASAIAAAGDHACAAISSGEIQCWGANERGQLGDGTREDRATPVRWSGVSPSDPADPSVVVGEAEASAGLDVSYHSGGVDFHGARAAGHGFGFTLATAGEDFRDPLLPSHWARLAEAGLHRGVYHFFVAADDPASQAEWFLSQLALEEGDLPPVVDIETLGDDPPHDLADRLRLFLETVEAEVGARPILYTGPAFWNRHLGEGFGEYPLWIAHYDVPQPTVPRGWTGWTFWQWKGDARVEGVGDPLDLNRLAPGVVLKDLLLGKRDEGPEPSDAGD